MKIELKNVKIAAFASEETTCFQASLYIDGKKVAAVENRGHGGCNFYHFSDRSLEKAFHEFCKSLPPLQDPQHGPLSMDADLYVSELLDQFEREKQYKRWCKKETLFRLQGDPSGQFRAIKAPFSSSVKDHLIQKYGTQLESILNERSITS